MSSEFMNKRATRLWSVHALLALVFLLGPPAWAGPTGEQVVAGSAAITRPDAATTLINQHTDKAIINWQGFSIASQELVTFQQPGTGSIALNRVVGPDPSHIFGRLEANGQVFLVNPHGVLFAPGSQVSVHGLLATTHDISNEDFLAGRYTFNRTGAGADVINRGLLEAADHGYIVLAGDYVSNSGIIQARLGRVVLAAGDRFTLDFEGDELITLVVDEASLADRAGVENLGEIFADGGKVLMTARVAGELTGAVVNHEGLVRARTIEEREGEILLLAGMEGGAFSENNTVRVAGTLDASAPEGGDGGFIETSAVRVNITDDAVITTHASHGRSGTWLIDPINYTIAPSGGDITGAALSTALTTTNVIITNAPGPGDGDIFVNDTVTWSANKLTLSAWRNIEINRDLYGSGTAQLALEYGQGGGGNYSINNGAKVFLTAGWNFTTKLGVNEPISYYVITSLGSQGSTTGTDLQGMIGNLSRNYALGADIDALATSDWNGGLGFQPVHDAGEAHFSGNFDGLGHTISNLYINRPETNYVGLFGEVSRGWPIPSDSHIKNVTLENVNITGKDYVGGLVGYMTDLSGGLFITNSSVSGAVNGRDFVGGLAGGTGKTNIANASSFATVEGRDFVGGLVGGYSGSDGLYSIIDSYAMGNVVGASNVGGLVGQLSSSTTTGDARIVRSYATGNVTGTGSYVGGLVGNLHSAWVDGGAWIRIFESYAAGNVAGTSSVGGLVGRVNVGAGDYSIIQDSYATGNVTGTGFYAGGLVGTLQGVSASNGFIERTYSTGTVTGDSSVGGLVGTRQNGYTISGSYWDTDTSGFLDPDPINDGVGTGIQTGVMGLTTAEMMQEAEFDGFNFTTVWWLSEDNTRPFLRSEYSTTITNAHQLQLMWLDLAADYTLGTDIDMSELTNPSGMWNTTKGFVPIGESFDDSYSGSFDGNGHTITGLYINRPTTDYVGLFGYVLDGDMSNVGLEDVNITGQDSVGGLIGRMRPWVSDEVMISNSSVSGVVTGKNDVGGLVGYTLRTTIADASSSVSVTGAEGRVGGLVGGYHVIGGSTHNIIDSYATGNVEGFFNVGGLVGSFSTTDGQGAIVRSFSTGTVAGTADTNGNIGGLVGYFGGRGQISESYATGNVTTGEQVNVGGLVGHVSAFGSDGLIIQDSYATGTVTGGNRVGGLVGRLQSGTDSNVFISRTYSVGSVTGTSNVGGLVGEIGEDTSVDESYSESDVTVTGGFGGGLVGTNRGTISNSYSEGTVTSSGSYTGGLVGFSEGEITSSYATGNVIATGASGNNSAGGLVGSSSGAAASITGSYATGNVSTTGGFYAGGLAAINNGMISSSYATGSVTGSYHVGGLVGWNDISGSITDSYYATGDVQSVGPYGAGGLVGENYGVIARTYSTGAVAGTINNVGGLVGWNLGSADVTNSYWDMNTTGQTLGVGMRGGSDVFNANGLTTAQMMQQTSFVGWSFGNPVWGIDEGVSYPYLLWERNGAPGPGPGPGPTPGPSPIHDAGEQTINVVKTISTDLVDSAEGSPVAPDPFEEPAGDTRGDVAGEGEEDEDELVLGEELTEEELSRLPLFDIKDGGVAGQQMVCQ